MFRYLAIAFFLLFSNANGVVLSPLVEEICDKEITSKNSVKTFRASNSTDSIIGVEVILKRVLKRQNGEELRIDAKKDELDWYPKQFILKPKASKNFRVQLSMKDMPDKEYAYRVIVKEHPLNFEKQNEEDGVNKVSPTLKMVFNYEGFLFIRKCSYKDDLKVKEFKLLKENKQIALTIKNNGKKSVVPSMKSVDFIIKTDSKEYNLLGKIAKTKRIFPGGENIFVVDIKGDDVLNLKQKDIKSVEIIKKD